MNGQLNFQIGDKVVYPNHGVGVIVQISSRTIGPEVYKFYLLKIKASSLKVEVPFSNVGTVGLRPVVKNGEVIKILNFLVDGKCDNHTDWKFRFKENSDKIKAAFLPREKNAGPRPLSAGDRACHVEKYRRGRN